MIVSLQIETLKKLLESYDKNEHINLMLGEGVDIFPDPRPASSFDAAKQILAQMGGTSRFVRQTTLTRTNQEHRTQTAS